MLVSKYCASGNDFIILHSFSRKDRSSMAIELCNRFYGIGADGLVVLLPYGENANIIQQQNNIAYQWEFYNSDGSMADMCGNASRAASLYAYHNNLAPAKHSFLSGSGIINTCVQELIDSKRGIVQSKLGKYFLEGNVVEHRKGNVYEFEYILMNIPHLVCCANSMKDYLTLSNDLEFLSHLRHKHNANVNIAFKDGNIIYYTTFERGVEGITQACGTGACAVYVSFRDFHKEYTLVPPSKEKLQVSCKDDEIYFAGLVSRVCECVV